MSKEIDDEMKYDKGGWDPLFWGAVQTGDAVVCAAPFAVPEFEEIEIKRGENLDALRKALTDPDQSVPTIRKGALKCKTGLIRFGAVKDRTALDELEEKFITGKIKKKKLKCRVKRRPVGGNFAKMKCKGLWRDVADDKTIRCEGHNVYGDELTFKMDFGEIPASVFRGVYADFVGQCHKDQIVVPDLVQQKSADMMEKCTKALLFLSRVKEKNEKMNHYANPIRGLITRPC